MQRLDDKATGRKNSLGVRFYFSVLCLYSRHVAQAGLLCAVMVLFGLQSARADYVGELETTKYFDQPTIDLIKTRIGQGTSLLAGDQISYYIQFTPTNNGGDIAGGGYVTDYIPAGTQVVNAQFVRINSDGSYTQVAPPGPAAEFPVQVPLYSDTGIFYSTDTRTRPSPANSIITAANGFALPNGTGCGGISLPSTSHNAWDNAMVTKFVGSSNNSSGTCAVPPAITYSTYGLSPVAGPDTYLTMDSTGVVGPWQRISYAGSMKGTATGVVVTGYANNASVSNACVGGVSTAAGWNLSTSNPLPINTNAVRFAAGKVSVGELFSVRITLKLTVNLPSTGLINSTEVFGGDASLDPGNGAAHPGIFSQWRYFCPAVASSNSSLYVLKTLVGACAGVGCVPFTVSAGVVPSVANLKLRYSVQYLNLSGSPQTNVVLKDTLATGGVYVASSYVQTAGTAIGAPTGTTTLTFPTIASLASGGGGSIQYDVNFATAPADATALINTAQLVSTQVPTPGVTSKAIATVSSKANLWIGKTTSTPSVAPGSLASYTITIPNNGSGNATSVVVKDFLPSAGGSTVNDRFAFASLTSATITSAAGVVTTVVPTVSSGVVATSSPYTGLNREQVIFTLPAATAIPMFGKLTITFSATVGTNIPASAIPYLNDTDVWYAGGSGGTAANTNMSEAIGVAPVSVTTPMTLTLKVDCVYAGATCVPYTNGTIAPGSKIKYKLVYTNLSASALSGVVLTDTLPINVNMVSSTALRDGVAVTPTVSGQLLTFPSFTLNASTSGYISFDAQLCTAVGTGCTAVVTSGTDLVNTAKFTSTAYPAGVQATVTTSVRDHANLQITKTVTPSIIQIGGTVTYTITVTNTGNAVANNIVIYDELPFVGSIADVTKRFNFNVGTSVFATNDTAANKLLAVTPTTAVPPTFSGYTVQTNQQEILWTFDPLKELAVGKSFTLTYTATAGTGVPASVTPYSSDVQASFNDSALTMMFASATNTALVTIGVLDHVRILHNAQGLTCMPETVTLQACGDVACSLFYTGSTVTTTINGNPTPITFSSSTTASIAVTTAGVYTLGATSTTPIPQTAARCFVGGAETCSMTFTDAGFVVSSGAGGAEVVVPTQISGVTSAAYQLRAVQTDKITMACQTALTGAQTVNISYECNNPTSCYTSNLMSVNGGVSTVIQGNSNGSALTYTPINMTFDSSGNAPFTFNYSDAGQVTLHFNKIVNAATINGASNAFVVKPSGFVLSGIMQTSAPNLVNPAAVNATGAKFVKAGENFNVTVTAINALGSTTPNYGKEIVPEGAKLTSALVAGLGQAVNPAVSGTFGAFSNGVAVANGVTLLPDGVTKSTPFTWNEVGLITLTPSVGDASYLGVGDVTGTASANVGRFYPAKYALSSGAINNRTDFASCVTSGCGSFTYEGENFDAKFTLTAQAIGGTTTQNYVTSATPANNFAKLDPRIAGNPLVLGALDNAAIRTPMTARLVTSALATGSFIAGVANVGVSVQVSRGATPDGPYTALNVGIAPQDTDGVIMASYDLDTTNVVSATFDHTKVASTEVRYGRVKLSNGHGSELLQLPLQATVQYWNGSGYVTSITDSLSNFLASNILFSNCQKLTASSTWPLTCSPAPTFVSPASIVFASGIFNYRLSAPGAGKTGGVDLKTNAPSYLPSTTGRATFGVYKASNELIYLREQY